MEREALLCILSACVFVLVAGTSGTLADLLLRAEMRSERGAWWALAAPVFAAIVGMAFLVGWALQEPEPADEWAGGPALALALGAAAVLLRAVLRACAALRSRGEPSLVATVGLVSPRLIVAPEFTRRADPRVLSAALAHETAHHEHKDPLRIWVTQFLADLQWPLPGASRRWRAWLVALEVERDDEAVLGGAEPVALAEAIVLAARLSSGRWSRSAGVAGDGSGIRHRVRRLVASTSSPRGRRRPATRCALGFGCAVSLATSLWLGFVYGEAVLRWLPALAA